MNYQHLPHRVVVIVAAVIATGCIYIPGNEDREQAKAISTFITERYAHFGKRSEVERTHKGKIYYVAPGRHPLVQFYEITEPQDIASIEENAKEGLAQLGIEKVRLVFFEKQNLHCIEGGGCSRRSERVIKEIVIAR